MSLSAPTPAVLPPVSGEKHPSWPHQLIGYWRIRALWERYQGALAAMGMGTGKTKLAIDLAGHLAPGSILVLAPLRVIQVWMEQLEMHASFPYQVAALDDRVDSIEQKAALARDTIAQARAAKRAAILLVNYESAWREPLASFLLNHAWGLLILDECVPPGSRILTPDGERPIETLRVGGSVLGYDHATNSIVETRISATFHRDTIAPLLHIHGAQLTPEHPVWTTNRGYIPARLVDPTDEVLLVQNKNLPPRLPILPHAILSRQKDKRLLHQKLSFESDLGEARSTLAVCADHAPAYNPARCPGETPAAPDIRKQPLPGPQSESEGAYAATQNGVLNAQRRQWNWPKPTAKAAGATTEMADGMGRADSGETEFRLPNSLQDRYRGTSTTDRHRSRWPNAPSPSSARKGQQERRLLDVTRLAGSAVLEHGDPGKPGRSREPHPVFNLETGTGNYFVNGLLVHNCHRLKAVRGKQSGFGLKLSKRAVKRLGLSGTPLPHSQLDAWMIFQILQKGIYPETFTEFKSIYVIPGGYLGKEIKGWRNEDDFRQRFHEITYRVRSEDVLDLPPEMDQRLYCRLAPRTRQIYSQLQDDLVSWLHGPEEQITIKNALVLLLRLQQLTGGTLKTDDEIEHHIDSSKEELLADWLTDIPRKEPIVVFARFRADLDAIRRACATSGHTYTEASGRYNGIAEWKAGQASVLAAQIQAAGEGQDFTRARLCAYYSIGFSLAQYLQSRKRLHRPGQTRPVVYYHLLAQDTVDEITLRAVLQRWDLVESAMKELKQCRPNSIPPVRPISI